jgi:ethanolamine permease
VKPAVSPSIAESPDGLQRSLGWVQIASIGVAIAISGNFSGWNYGLAVGGWGGMFVAALFMSVLFVGLTQIVGELAAALPATAGFDGYVRHALGRELGAAAGMMLLAGLAIGSGLAATFIASYAQSLAGYGAWPVKLGLILAVTLLQLRGVQDSIRATLLTGAIAVLSLSIFCCVVAPHFSAVNLATVTPHGSTTLFPQGWGGIFACIPFALFFFIGVEQAALAAPEAKDVSRTIPKSLISAVTVALIIGFSVLILATGVAGTATLAAVDDPLYAAIGAARHATTPHGLIVSLVSTGAIVSLLGTLFSLSYAASRQCYALSVNKEIIALFAVTNRHRAPYFGLLLVALIGTISAAINPDVVMVVFIFLLNLTYQCVIFAFIVLRRRETHLARPFMAFGGKAMATVSAVLSLAVLASCVVQQPLATLIVAACIAVYLILVRAVRRVPNVA